MTKNNAWYIAATLSLGLGLGLALLSVLNGGLPARAGPAESVAAELHVCPSGCAYASIQDAVDAANLGDVIKVAQGIYTDVHIRDGITQVVYLSKSVSIRGGYTAAFTDPPDPLSNPTTLDAQGQGRVLYITGEITPTIKGLRITGGDAEGLGGSWRGDVGGGIYVNTAQAVISGNIVYSNTADSGGGLGLDRSPAILEGNTIFSNVASVGGGLNLDYSPATLNRNTISGNTAGGGGGMNLGWSDATLKRNVVRDNIATWRGGGLYFWDCASTLTNNVIVGNQVNLAGSGLFVDANSDLRMRHSTLAHNIGGDGTGVYVNTWAFSGDHYPSTVLMTNTIIVSHSVAITVTTGSTVTLNATLWQANGTNIDGAGSISTLNDYSGEPAFAADGNHLTAGSAATDQGVDAGVTEDIDGEPRPCGAGYDIGADEVCPALTVTKQADPDPVQAGGPLTYTIRIINTGSVDLRAIVTDTLPAHILPGQTSGGTAILPGGTFTWTPTITAPGGLWTEQVVVTVEVDYAGPPINVVRVNTKEGATGIYTETSTAIVEQLFIYLPLEMR